MSFLKRFLFVLSFFVGINSWAQIKDNAPRNRDMVLVDMYHNNWFHNNKTLNTKWYSRGIGINYLYEFPIVKKRVTFAVGVGLNNYNFYHRSNLTEIANPDTAIGGTYSQFTSLNADSLGVKTNKLTLTYGDFPLEFRYKGLPNKKGKSFKFTLGVRAGYRLDIHSKRKDNTGKYKEYNYNNAERWRFGAHMRVGYNRIAFMSYYNFNSVFKSGFGESLTPFAIGITYTLLD